MNTVTRTDRQFFNIPGTLTSADGLSLSVCFDLVEFEDLIDGKPGHKRSYGILRYQDPLDPFTSERLLSAAQLVLTGGGVHSTLCLYKLNSFTLVETIKDFSREPYLIAA